MSLDGVRPELLPGGSQQSASDTADLWWRVPFGFAILVLFLWGGQAGVYLSGISFPAPVLGMLMLFAALRLGWIRVAWIHAAAQFLLSRMGLFFVPPGVGLMRFGNLLAQHWPAFAFALVVSAVLTLLAVAHGVEFVERRRC